MSREIPRDSGLYADEPGPDEPRWQMQTARVLEEVRAERDRQRVGEGFTRSHDDRHTAGHLARAGAWYAIHASITDQTRALLARGVEFGGLWRTVASLVWPWPRRLFKPKDERRRELVIAAAFIVAEIEKMDREAQLYGVAPAITNGDVQRVLDHNASERERIARLERKSRREGD